MNTAASQIPLSLRLLGVPSIEAGGQSVQLPAKAIAVLAYLAVTRPTAPRARVIALLWPESGEEAGRKNLRNLLWTIQKALGGVGVEVAGEQLGLSEAVTVDVRVFEATAVTDPATAS